MDYELQPVDYEPQFQGEAHGFMGQNVVSGAINQRPVLQINPQGSMIPALPSAPQDAISNSAVPWILMAGRSAIDPELQAYERQRDPATFDQRFYQPDNYFGAKGDRLDGNQGAAPVAVQPGTTPWQEPWKRIASYLNPISSAEAAPLPIHATPGEVIGNAPVLSPTSMMPALVGSTASGAAPLPRPPEEMATAKAADMHDAFQGVTGRELGSSPNDLTLIGRGDVTLPPHIKSPDDFAAEVQAKVNDVKAANTPDKRYWYEHSGDTINLATGRDPEMSDRVTAGVAKTSQSTPVIDNAAYTARAHNQAMVGDPIKAGRYPNEMGRHIEGYYNESQPNVVGEKITGYQSGFRTAWNPDMLNRGANDIWNMRWLGYKRGAGGTAADDAPQMWDQGYKGTPTTGQHNYDRFLRSAVTDRLNAEGFDGGGWQPGQVQAVGWAHQREQSGVPADEGSFNISNAFQQRAARLTYESAPGQTTNHLPEYHSAPDQVKQDYHNSINGVLQDQNGRDIIASHFGLLTLPTEHGIGVFEGGVNPGSAARVVTGNMPGGWKGGYDPATAELMKGAELTRGLLLQQDAVASHFPQFPQSGLTKNNANMVDVRTGSPMSEAEARTITQHMKDATGTDFFSPVFTNQGYRFINVPEASGMSNPAFHKAVDQALNKAYPDQTVQAVRGASTNFYQGNDWSKGNAGYLEGLRSLRPDVQRRAAELLATLGPKVSAVQDQFAAQHGWTANPNTRIWETNPGYQTFDTSKITPGQQPQPWSGAKRDFRQDLLTNPPPSLPRANPNAEQSLSEAYLNGRAAYSAGHPLGANPEDAGTKFASEWDRGYKIGRKQDRFNKTIAARQQQ